MFYLEQNNKVISEIVITENTSPVKEQSLPPVSRTPMDKPLAEMSAIEYYWHHKKQNEDSHHELSSNKSINLGLSEKPQSSRSSK